MSSCCIFYSTHKTLQLILNQTGEWSLWLHWYITFTNLFLFLFRVNLSCMAYQLPSLLKVGAAFVNSSNSGNKKYFPISNKCESSVEIRHELSSLILQKISLRKASSRLNLTLISSSLCCIHFLVAIHIRTFWNKSLFRPKTLFSLLFSFIGTGTSTLFR